MLVTNTYVIIVVVIIVVIIIIVVIFIVISAIVRRRGALGRGIRCHQIDDGVTSMNLQHSKKKENKSKHSEKIHPISQGIDTYDNFLIFFLLGAGGRGRGGGR